MLKVESLIWLLFIVFISGELPLQSVCLSFKNHDGGSDPFITSDFLAAFFESHKSAERAQPGMVSAVRKMLSVISKLQHFF